MGIIHNLALVLSGGSFKVMFQIRLLIFLEKCGIYPKEIFAISGGVPNALAYMLRKAWKLPALWKEIEPKKLFQVDWVGLFIIPLLRGEVPIFAGEGVFKSGFLERILRREIDYRLVLDSPIVIWVGVMDLAKGKLVWISNKDSGMTPERFEEHVVASMRIPVFFRPHGQKVDMGLVSNIAIGKAVERGFENILALSALPFELEEISGVETWPESNLRHDDISHADEVSAHVKRTEEINQEVLAMRAHRRHWLTRICCFLSRSYEDSLDRFPLANKLFINLCVIFPPSGLRIFRKWVTSGMFFRYVPRQQKITYGYPSLEAREELLRAGEDAIEQKLKPFLARL